MILWVSFDFPGRRSLGEGVPTRAFTPPSSGGVHAPGSGPAKNRGPRCASRERVSRRATGQNAMPPEFHKPEL